jgi:hypothetical protein
MMPIDTKIAAGSSFDFNAKLHVQGYQGIVEAASDFTLNISVTVRN